MQIHTYTLYNCIIVIIKLLHCIALQVTAKCSTLTAERWYIVIWWTTYDIMICRRYIYFKLDTMMFHPTNGHDI